MMKLGIRDRILLAAVVPALLVALAITLLQVREQSVQSHAEQHRRLAAIARQIASIAAYDLFVGNHDALQKLLDAARGDPDITGAAILDVNGTLLASTIPVDMLPTLEAIHAGFAIPAGSETIDHWHSQAISASRDMGADLFAGSADQPPLGHVLLRVTNTNLEQDIRIAMHSSAGLALLMLLFAILLAWLLSRGLINALADIGYVVDGVGRGRYDLRAAESGKDELGQLAIGINRMTETVGQTQEMLAARISAATETLRNERDAAQRAAQARSRFFAAASHDLRQPVQALGLFVVRLEQDAAQSTLQPGIRRLADAVRNLQGLLDTLLDYSRLDGHVFQVRKAPVGARQLIGPLTEDFATAAAQKRLILRTRIADCCLFTDAALLRRILINLIGNAVRHTREGSILIACRRGQGHARIEVWDTGPGIAPEHQDSIFDELVQLENPERDPAKGLGLGLAIVRRSAELLHHPLSLYSQPGRGTRFSLRIPLAAEPMLVDEQNELAPPPPVLLVGSGSDILRNLRDQLNDWQFDCQHRDNLAQAREWIKQHGPPALIIFTTTTGIPGIEAAQTQLKRLEKNIGHALPVLFISATPVPGWQNCEDPPRHLLLQPFRPAQLRALLMYLLPP